ncbi:MAG: metallophosphoesterase family protein [Candidatus Saganbacteria bacterium]|nr:metallophosphoesterase family protein [Candidatus Saganbacteria bacterium]
MKLKRQAILVFLMASLIFLSSCGKQAVIPASQLLKGPYMIYLNDNTTMKVLWQTDITPATSKIEWGSSISYGSSADVTVESYSASDMHDFRYIITGLTPGTKVCYKITADDKSATGSFYAAPASSATSIVFYGFGDSQPKTGTAANFDAVSSALLADMNKDEANRHTIVLHGGDYVYRGRVEADWASGYFNNSYANIASLFADMPIMGTVGNHEFYDISGNLDTTHPNAFIDQYLQYPYYSDYYYSFDYGPLHVAVVDNYTSYSVGSDQYSWLSNDLTTSTKPWKIVMYHEAAFGNAYDNTTIQTNLHPLLVSKNIKLVLQAHIHSYCRSLKDGIQYVTLGGGGAPLNSDRGPAGTFDPTIIQKDAFVFHFGRFEITGDTLEATIIDKDGNTVDSFSVTR